MRRIAVLGCGGAGKSTFARRLGALLGLPVTHLDRHFWRPGWVAVETEEWRRLNHELVAGEAWVLDGNYGGTMDIRFAAADTVIFLDFPTRTCLWRALRRIAADFGQENEAPGCPEHLDLEFLRWIWRWRRDSRPRTLLKLAEHGASTRQFLLSTPREAEAFLAGLVTRG